MNRRHVLADLRPYLCTFPDCSLASETYIFRAKYVEHEVYTHDILENRILTDGIICLFCGERIRATDDRSQHVGRHMEEIAFSVVSKPYDKWSFYSDSSSAFSKNQERAEPSTLVRPDSVASSVSNYGSNSDTESVNSRTLPRLSGLVGNNALSAPQSMMGQFNSKVSSSTQKKHKCKICDRRFTLSSSLQTHMYSHTGEKPFACETEGCGRHFSVVSNLRRHRKVHKIDRASDHGSSEHSWISEE